jgi:hypothetical protein
MCPFHISDALHLRNHLHRIVESRFVSKKDSLGTPSRHGGNSSAAELDKSQNRSFAAGVQFGRCEASEDLKPTME